MQCPYCSEEMIPGYLKCRGKSYVGWKAYTSPEGFMEKLDDLLNPYDDVLVTGYMYGRSEMNAYKCQACAKIIIDLNQEGAIDDPQSNTAGIPKDVLKSIRESYPKAHIEPIRAGASGAGVFQLSEGQPSPVKIIKVVEVDAELDSLSTEVALYRWLKGQVPVPEVFHFEQVEGAGKNYEWLVMSRIEGADLKSRIGHVAVPEQDIAYRYGAFLRQVHELPIAGCPIEVRLEEKLRRAKWLIDNNRVDAEDFEAAFEGVSIEELYRRLEAERPMHEDLVVTHGDYCLDNVLVNVSEQDLALTGFIDLSMGGVQDRYQDLALAYRSIRKKLGVAYTEDFLQGYGLIDAFDMDKINYYIMMDEVF